eukprot:CAMPEP_0115742938 /NCGR_PEP_ID=MMETSP0272-20121206/90802_1 /TAXON_ID=71861 /ORGANISM="Scrippsiella trochoidea, Strain CCMP3099" /LENGTH=78 /DNA_ID=CAMNT_0003187709 /DNA_START=51 /DNA_END=287 /DNA_ORIENTATION=-
MTPKRSENLRCQTPERFAEQKRHAIDGQGDEQHRPQESPHTSDSAIDHHRELAEHLEATHTHYACNPRQAQHPQQRKF